MLIEKSIKGIEKVPKAPGIPEEVWNFKTISMLSDIDSDVVEEWFCVQDLDDHEFDDLELDLEEKMYPLIEKIKTSCFAVIHANDDFYRGDWYGFAKNADDKIIVLYFYANDYGRWCYFLGVTGTGKTEKEFYENLKEKLSMIGYYENESNDENDNDENDFCDYEGDEFLEDLFENNNLCGDYYDGNNLLVDCLFWS